MVEVFTILRKIQRKITKNRPTLAITFAPASHSDVSDTFKQSASLLVFRRLSYFLNTISYTLGQRGNWKIGVKKTRRKFKELHVSQQSSDLPSLSVAVYVRFLPLSGNEMWDGNELEWSLNKNLNTYLKVEKRITMTLSLRYLHIGTFY